MQTEISIVNFPCVDVFSTNLDYVLDDAGNVAILYHVHLNDVSEEIEAFEIR